MNIHYVILAAIAPVLVLVGYIIWRDREHPEPALGLLKAFFFGILSIPLTLALHIPFGPLCPVDLEHISSIDQAFQFAFTQAALPEEIAKCIMLVALLRHNRDYDEYFDGIVYAVCVGMGFAAVENIMYLFGGLEDGSWLHIGITRALFAVPGHFLFAVLMGYYYALFTWSPEHKYCHMACTLLVPVMAHGLYDGILMSQGAIGEGWSAALTVVFLIFFIRLHRIGRRRIKNLTGK